MKLTNYEKNVLAMLDRKVTEFIAKKHARAMRRSIVPEVLQFAKDESIRQKMREELRGLLPMLVKLTPESLVKHGYTSKNALVLRALHAKCWVNYAQVPKNSPLSPAACLAVELLKEIHASADALELECMLPPPRRERKRRPKTLVGRRAASVDRQVQKWQRRLKLAKTKLAGYQKKQRYYQKKGAVTA